MGYAQFAAGETAESLRSRERADRAMEALRRAIAQGYRFPGVIFRDADLDPLRPRPDFRLLMMDLVMPGDPFARGE
jgi:hypothetical protein